MDIPVIHLLLSSCACQTYFQQLAWQMRGYQRAWDVSILRTLNLPNISKHGKAVRMMHFLIHVDCMTHLAVFI